MIGYEQIINEVIRKRHISYEEVLFSDNGLVVTVKEFVDKTKKMTEWHRRLTDDLCDIESENGDVRKYMIEFVKEKMKKGYSFIEE